MRIAWLVYALVAGALGCDAGVKVAAPANHVAQDSPCEAAFAHSRATVAGAKLAAPERVLAQVRQCWSDDAGAWAIALDALCKIPPASFDNTTETVTLVGRWVVMYMPNGGPVATATYAPHVYTGDTEPCIDYAHPGNIATSDPDHVVDAHGMLNGHQLVLVGTGRVLQDHPEISGTSLLDWTETERMTFRDGEIEVHDESVPAR